MRRTILTFGLLLAAMTTNAAEPAKSGRVLAFMKSQGLYNLCTLSRSAELWQCEGFITGVAAMM